MALLEKNSKSSLYKGMNSFWIKTFKDSGQLEAIYTGAEGLLGNMYLDLMETVLSKSLTTTPVFKKQDWEVLILQDNLLSFDPPVPSADVYKSALMDLSVTADAVSPDLDEVYVSFTDMGHRRLSDVDHYPTHGIYNHKTTGKSTNGKNWTVVVPSNLTIKESIAAVTSRVVSNQKVDLAAMAEDIYLQLVYNEKELIDVAIKAEDLTTMATENDLAAFIEGLINKEDTTVTIEAGHLVIQTDGRPIRAKQTSTACEELLFIRQFNHVVSVRVPLDLEATALWSFTHYLQLITEGYRASGVEYRFAVSKVGKNLRSAKFVMNTIYSPTLILEEGKDYIFNNGFLYFKQNPFEMENVAFRIIDGHKQLAFWMSDVAYDNDLLYKRYGYRFTAPQDASEEYKLFLRGIMFYYTNGPDVSSIRAALNLIAGIPVAVENDELVLRIEPGKIFTDKNEYEIPPLTTPIVAVGQVLNAFDVLTDAFEVEDYIINPEWYNNIFIPQTLMPGANAEARQLKREVSVPNVGDSSFVVGPLDTSTDTLITDDIYPYGSGLVPYATSADASFTLELPAANKYIDVVVPKDYTKNATTLDGVATAINKALTQVTGVPFSSTNLDAPATFEIICDQMNTKVLIPAGVYPALLQVVEFIAPQLPEGLTVGITPDGEKLVFMHTEGLVIDIKRPSVTAQANLGIQGAASFQGLHVKAVERHLEFANLSSDTTSMLRVRNIDAIALASWGMRPFREGSGSMVGEDGQSNISYKIFDEILKFNTFKISFNLGNFTVNTSLDEIVNIVVSGKPSYTSPLITPYIKFEDTMLDTDIVFESPSDATPTEEAQHADVVSQQSVDMVFTDFDGVRLHYDEEFKEVEYISFDPVGARVSMNNGLSEFSIMSEDMTIIGRHHHKFTVGVENSLEPEDESLFASPGVYNIGKQTIGASYGPKNLAKKNAGVHQVGVYAADTSLVTGIDLAELDHRISHMFVIDRSMEDRLVDIGYGIGDFLELKHWPDDGNNGRHGVLSMSYDVKFNGQLVDIIWFRNPLAVEDNINSGKSIYDGSTYSLSHKSDSIGKSWFITLPEADSIRRQVELLLEVIGDDKAIFPFDISFFGEDTEWKFHGYLELYGLEDPREPTSFLGERYQTTLEWDRKFHIGDGAYVEPFKKLITDMDEFTYENAFLIGVAPDDLGDNLILGNSSTYAGGDFSTKDTQIISATRKMDVDTMKHHKDGFNGSFIISDHFPEVGDNYEVGDHDWRQLWAANLMLDGTYKLDNDTYESVSGELIQDSPKMLASQAHTDSNRLTMSIEHPYMEVGGSYVFVGSTSFYIQDLPPELRGPQSFEYLLIYEGDFMASPIPGYQEHLA